MRAFLSHSSHDKDFVRSIAAALGRARVVFDAYEFSTGDDFRAAIQKGLERSELFVLFASKASLSSDWVKFELSEAEAAVTSRALARGVCYIIDDQVDLADIPTWMKGGLITREANSKLVALDIRRLINDRLSTRRPRLFVGRNDKMDEALDLITSDVKPLIVYGLPGIGRRTFIREVARN